MVACNWKKLIYKLDQIQAREAITKKKDNHAYVDKNVKMDMPSEKKVEENQQPSTSRSMQVM